MAQPSPHGSSQSSSPQADPGTTQGAVRPCTLEHVFPEATLGLGEMFPGLSGCRRRVQQWSPQQLSCGQIKCHAI